MEREVVIVGAGPAGCAAAIFLRQRGRDVLLLDAAEFPRDKICGESVSPGAWPLLTDLGVAKAVEALAPWELRGMAITAPSGIRFAGDYRDAPHGGIGVRRLRFDAMLLDAARAAGVEVRHPWRVAAVRRDEGGFTLTSATGDVMRARRVVLATGGRSLPKTGSDGGGYALATALGHTLTSRIFPGLVPLVVADGHFVRGLRGISVPAALEVRSASGRRRAEAVGSLLCTHFGLSGPAALDVSRHLIDARFEDPASALVVRWLPEHTAETLDRALREVGGTVGGFLQSRLPERLARALCAEAGVEPATPAHRLSRGGRRALARAVAEMTVPVTGDRGYAFAEVTAGGVPLRELHLDTLGSRVCPGLSLCGEICDVDGRIGGFNFQWAWASGYVAGTGAFAGDRASAHPGHGGRRRHA